MSRRLAGSFGLKAAILAALAAGFFCALSAAASADVVDTHSALQPSLVKQSRVAGVDVAKPSTDPLAATSTPTEIKKVEPAPATPAPEQMVTRSISASVPSQSSGSPITRAVQPLRRGMQRIGSYLERVASSCPVAPVSSTGGPVLVLAVLSVGLALNRRWVLAAQPATDERVPEFLYAWELTPPG